MITNRTTSWRHFLPLLAVLAPARTMPACFGSSPDAAAAATRLELATGSRDGVLPVAVAADRSRWRPVTEPAGGAPAIDIATRDVVRWGTCPPWPLGPAVLLADGGVIAGRITAADEKTVVIESPTFGRLALPAGAARGYRAGQATGPAAIGPATERGDRRPTLLLANGDRVSARRIAWQGETVTIETAARAATPVAISADIVRAVDFAVPIALPSPAQPRLRILAAIMDGSRFVVAAVEPAPPLAGVPRARLLLELAGLTTAADCDAAEILALAVDGGRATFLAGREPTAHEQAIDLGPTWPLARGHAVSGDWPAIRGRSAFSALGIHAPARVRYRLDRPATRFDSLVAIDDSAGAGGSVVVRVLAGDGGAVGREVFSSPVLHGGDAPTRIRAEFPPAAELELVVDAADNADVLDRTLWLDPLVVDVGD